MTCSHEPHESRNCRSCGHGAFVHAKPGESGSSRPCYSALCGCDDYEARREPFGGVSPMAVEPCGATGGTPSLPPCSLPLGHEGNHRDSLGGQWRRGGAPEALHVSPMAAELVPDVMIAVSPEAVDEQLARDFGESTEALIARLTRERDEARRQRDELQEASTRQVIERRNPLRTNVQAFHKAFNVPAPSAPMIPSDDRVRLRLRLIAEEFFETLYSCGYGATAPDSPYLHDVEARVVRWIETAVIRVDLEDVADCLADMAYVIEGTFQEFGVDSTDIHAEVQRSNMAKVGGTVRADGKILKPPGWTSPDIAGVLRRQGWRP